MLLLCIIRACALSWSLDLVNGVLPIWREPSFGPPDRSFGPPNRLPEGPADRKEGPADQTNGPADQRRALMFSPNR